MNNGMEAVPLSVWLTTTERIQHCLLCGKASAFIDPDSGYCLPCLNGPLNEL